MGYKKKLKLERWIKHEERSLSNKWYSIGRIDLLIITISSGALYVIFETLKFVTENKPELDLDILKYSSSIFTISIVVNFISQILGFYANKYESIYANKIIKIETDKNIDKEEYKRELRCIDMDIRRLNSSLNIVNILSVIAMLIGIVLLGVFYWRF